MLLLSASNSYAIAGNWPVFGQSALQVSTGTTVRDACIGMVGLTLVGESAELFDCSSDLINTGNQLDGAAALSAV